MWRRDSNPWSLKANLWLSRRSGPSSSRPLWSTWWCREPLAAARLWFWHSAGRWFASPWPRSYPKMRFEEWLHHEMTQAKNFLLRQRRTWYGCSNTRPGLIELRMVFKNCFNWKKSFHLSLSSNYQPEPKRYVRQKSWLIEKICTL